MKLKNQIKIALQVFLCVVIVIHITIKDYFYLSSLIFYATPLPLIALGILFLLLFVKASTRKYYIVTVLIILGIWVKNSYIQTTSENISEGFEIVLWNAYRTENFEDAFQENESLPDVMVLIECDEKEYASIQKKYPNYHFQLTEEAIGIFSKTPIKIHSNTTTKQNVTIVHFSTQNTYFYAIDVTANIKYFREPMLKSVISEIKTEGKTIILGDFNTPFESLFFKNFKKKYQHAFTKKGNGFRETWFWNIPLLSLDHIWVSNDLEILKTEKISTWKSDHSMLRMTLKNTAIEK